MNARDIGMGRADISSSQKRTFQGMQPRLENNEHDTSITNAASIRATAHALQLTT